ncbi:MAG: IreB family regulatory phosphoprotein [Clostridia bacterium]|nr:IreB family regulatory phosphoprotein [Clostridia bacterium]
MNDDKTMHFRVGKEDALNTRLILSKVYEALAEKGYNPINQLIGYLLSGDPAYITSHKGARNLIRGLERDEILEEILEYYLKSGNK